MMPRGDAARQTVVVTCIGGLGRSGTLAACLLVSAGTAPEAAIAAVGAARGPCALETIAQEDFVVLFASVIFLGALRLSPPWRARARPSGTGVTPPRRELSGPRPSA